MDVLARPGHPLRYSLYLSRFFPMRGEPVQALRQHLATQEPYDLVLPGDDPLVHALAVTPEPWAQACLPAAGELLLEAVDKTRFPGFCRRFGIPVPAGTVVRTHQELEDALGREPGPWILKGALGWGGNVIRKCLDRPAASAAFQELDDGKGVLLQQWIVGSPGSTFFYSHRGRLLRFNEGYKALCQGGELGPSSARRFVEHPGVERALTVLCAELQYHGLGGMDWMEEAATGRLFFTELNPRITPTLSLDRFTTQAQGALLAGLVSGVAPPCPWVKVDGLHYLFPQYGYRCLERGEWGSLFRLVPGFNKVDLPWRDPGIFLYQWVGLAKHAIKVLFKQLFGRNPVTG
jgi:hypothetical protein